MARKIKDGTTAQLGTLRTGIEKLKEARAYFRAADAPRTLARINAAISSAKGAERHMMHRLHRSET